MKPRPNNVRRWFVQNITVIIAAIGTFTAGRHIATHAAGAVPYGTPQKK
jgi:hypothetical protein